MGRETWGRRNYGITWTSCEAAGGNNRMQETLKNTL